MKMEFRTINLECRLLFLSFLKNRNFLKILRKNLLIKY